MLQDATTIEISCFLRAVLAVRNNIDARVPQVGDQIFVLNLQYIKTRNWFYSLNMFLESKQFCLLANVVLPKLFIMGCKI